MSAKIGTPEVIAMVRDSSTSRAGCSTPTSLGAGRRTTLHTNRRPESRMSSEVLQRQGFIFVTSCALLFCPLSRSRRRGVRLVSDGVHLWDM
jgi:hypothetical protein